MNRWAWRAVAVLMLLFFVVVFSMMHRQLVRLQQQRQGVPAAR
jgi:bacteriorhodopsin